MGEWQLLRGRKWCAKGRLRGLVVQGRRVQLEAQEVVRMSYKEKRRVRQVGRGRRWESG